MRAVASAWRARLVWAWCAPGVVVFSPCRRRPRRRLSEPSAMASFASLPLDVVARAAFYLDAWKDR